MVGLNSFFVRGVLEIQPAIVGQVLGGDSQLLAMATAAAGIGALLASAWIGWGRLQPDFVQRCLWPMLAIGLLGTAALDFASWHLADEHPVCADRFYSYGDWYWCANADPVDC